MFFAFFYFLKKRMFLHSLKTFLPLLKAARNHQKIILSPLPRFLTASCCSGAGQVKNRDDTDFGEKLMDDLVVLKRQIKDFCHINHLGGISSLNTAVLMSGMEGGRKLAAEEREELVASGDPTRSTHAKTVIRGWQPTSWANFMVVRWTEAVCPPLRRETVGRMRTERC